MPRSRASAKAAGSYPCQKCGRERHLKRAPQTTMCVKCAAQMGSEAAARKAAAVDPIGRLDDKWIEAKGGCWEWQAQKSDNGYGRFYLNGRQIEAHRASYMLRVGPIPDGMTIDHLCRNRGCVNPTHMEVVTHAENNRRGTSPSAINAAKDECINGHALAGENLYLYIGSDNRERRYCRECRRRRVREQQARKKGAENVA